MRKVLSYVVGLVMTVLFLDIGLTLLDVDVPVTYKEYVSHFAGVLAIMAAVDIGKLFIDVIKGV